MRIPTRLLLVSALLTATATGCYYRDCPTGSVQYYQDPAYVTVNAPPPALQAAVAVDARPPKPSANAVWIAGHYIWRGSWVWAGGHWEIPRPNYVWQPPVVARAGTSYRYHPGYWRPRQTRPATVYTQPHDVRVSVRPPSVQARGTVRVRTPGAQPPRGTVQVQTPGQQPSQPATVVRPQVRPPTGVVQPGQPRNPQTGAVVRPQVRPPTGVVQPGQPRNPQPAQPGAVIRPQVRPPTGVVQPGQPRNPQPTQPAPVVRPQVRPPAGTVRPGQIATPRPATRPQAGITVAATQAGTVQLTCRINTSRAPAGGLITITGTGFGRTPVVRIGGVTGALVNRSNTQLRVQVPRSSAGGAVSVRAGGNRAACGTLSIIGRTP